MSRGTTIVQAQRGHMLQYAGDNILAACGVDGSSEDDTERAMHRTDDESLDLLNYLAEVDRETPLLLLTFTRPTLLERRSDCGSGEAKHERIKLYLLQPTARRELVSELLKMLPEVPVTLTALIVGRAEGNPVYMQALVRMLIDRGAIDASGDPWRLNAERLLATPRGHCGMVRRICEAGEPQTENASWRDCSRTETGRLISVCCRWNDRHVTHKAPA